MRSSRAADSTRPARSIAIGSVSPVSTRTRPLQRSTAARWPWRSVSSSWAAVGRRAPSATLRASSRAVTMSTPVPTTRRRSTPPNAAADVGHRAAGLADVQQRANGRDVRLRAAQPRRQRDADEERRQIADGVAPALVLLPGRHHQVGQAGTRRAAAHRHQRGARAGSARGRDRLVRQRRPALVRDGDEEPGRRAAGAASRAPGRPDLAPRRCLERLVEQRGDRHRGVLAGPAAGDEDRAGRTTRLSRTASARAAKASSPASRCSSRSACAGSAAIISLIRYGGLPRNAGITDEAQGFGAPGSGSLEG